MVCSVHTARRPPSYVHSTRVKRRCAASLPGESVADHGAHGSSGLAPAGGGRMKNMVSGPSRFDPEKLAVTMNEPSTFTASPALSHPRPAISGGHSGNANGFT